MQRIIYILFALNVIVNAQSIEQFERAANYYNQEDYTTALNEYKGITDSDLQSNELYYNIANCYFKLNQLAPSILYYEKALKLSPLDEDSQFNLSIAKLQLVDKIIEIPIPFHLRVVHSIVGLCSLQTWSVLSLVFLGLFAIALMFLLFVNKSKVLNKKSLLLSGISFLILAIISFNAAYYIDTHTKVEAILMVDNAYVKSAPAKQSKDLFILHEGTKMEVIESFDQWTKIKLSDGMIGWLKSDTITTI
jgi:tetratricopeptide (TPR) repeat protein